MTIDGVDSGIDPFSVFFGGQQKTLSVGWLTDLDVACCGLSATLAVKVWLVRLNACRKDICI